MDWQGNVYERERRRTELGEGGKVTYAGWKTGYWGKGGQTQPVGWGNKIITEVIASSDSCLSVWATGEGLRFK